MLDALMSIGSAIMTPLYYLTSLVLVGWHQVLSSFLDPKGGLAWALSIVGLTLVIRIALIPLFVKQIKSSRNMQLLQPKVKELQKKYGHDREKLTQETMALYKETGTNPFASCLPILLQMPIFFALFRLIDHAAKNEQGHGILSDTLAKQFADSKLFGVEISRSFTDSGGDVNVQIMAAILVVAMTVTTFLTQRQLMAKNMPADALSGPYAQQQKMLLYVLPLVFAVGGVAFPIGVLLYWTTSNLWTMGQQFYVIRNNPAPGTPAFKAKEERVAAKAAKHGAPAVAGPSLEKGTDAGAASTEQAPKPTQRQQPQRQTRNQRKSQTGPAGSNGQARKQSGTQVPNKKKK